MSDKSFVSQLEAHWNNIKDNNPYQFSRANIEYMNGQTEEFLAEQVRSATNVLGFSRKNLNEICSAASIFYSPSDRNLVTIGIDSYDPINKSAILRVNLRSQIGINENGVFSVAEN